MNEHTLEKLIQQSQQKGNRIVQQQAQPFQYFTLKASQATKIQIMLNEQKSKDEKGFLLQQIRRPDQILYKTALKKPDLQSFAEYQERNLIQLYKQMNSVKCKLSQNQLHCFITLEQLRRHPLSKYFMALPDSLYLQRYDFKKEVLNPLDIRTIANKLLRRKYKSLEEFQVDMVTMIHNFRTYFMSEKELFDISIKFQMLFWDFYSNQQSVNKQAIQTFKYYKRRCTSSISRPKKPKSQYNIERKKKITKQFNRQPIEIKKIMIAQLQKGVMKDQLKNMSKQANVSKFKDQFFQQLQRLLRTYGQNIQENLGPKKKEQKKEKLQKDEKTEKNQKLKQRSPPKKKESNKQKKQVIKKDKNRSASSMVAEQEEIYYGDSEDQMLVQRIQYQKMTRDDVKQVMDMINQEAFFDSDDYE